MKAGSLNPPAIAELEASQGLPPSILLDARVYFADRKNSTTATLDDIQVSICFADPPALSHVCIHCPSYTEASFSHEPRVVRSEKQFLLLHLSLWGTGFEELVDEYYMYQAAIRKGKPPKLFRIPDLGPDLRDWLALDDFGIYCCDDDDGEEECIMAGLTYFRGYRLHSYSSASKVWTARPARMETELESLLMTRRRMSVAAHKVIPLGGSLLGWVDLWKGILVCDVLCQDPELALGFIPLPLTGNTYDHICPWVIRDVTCTDGSLKFIEIQHLFSVPPPVVRENKPSDLDVMYDETYFAGPQDDLEQTEPRKYVDWRATIWNRSLSENCWRKGFEVHGNDIVLVEGLGDCAVGVRNLIPSFPTLSIYGDDVVHMIFCGRLDIGEMQMISIDMSNSTLKALAPCPPLEADDDRPYFPCVLSNYLSNPPALPKVTQANISKNVPQIVQASNSKNITGNKRPRSCAQEIISVPNGGPNFDLSLVAQARNSENVDVDLPPSLQASNSENVAGNKRPRSCVQQVIGAPNHRAQNGGSNFRLSSAPRPSLGLMDTIPRYNGSHYEDADYQCYADYPRTSYGNYQQSLPLQQQPTYLPNWLHLPNWFPPRPVNPHPAYPVVNTASFRPMLYPFPQNDSRLLQTPSQANPHPAYTVVNTASFRPMVHPFPQFRPNDLHLFQAPSSQALLPPTHFSTPSIPPARRQ